MKYITVTYLDKDKEIEELLRVLDYIGNGLTIIETALQFIKDRTTNTIYFKEDKIDGQIFYGLWLIQTSDSYGTFTVKDGLEYIYPI